ncbi:MAG: hypothetical protein PHS46_08515 [Candidatus Omnitrophica bacterium]|nr:hypothetical protein [Candidatus Omnitrophota bacterium]
MWCPDCQEYYRDKNSVKAKKCPEGHQLYPDFEDDFYVNEITSKATAHGALQYFEANVSTWYEEETQHSGKAEADRVRDLLWSRIIKKCLEYGVPLPANVKAIAKRLGIAVE